MPSELGRTMFRLRNLALVLWITTTLSGIQDAGAASLQQVLNRGSLRAGIVLAAPWAMRAESGELTGFEFDVISKLASDLEVEAEFVIYRFDELVPALEAGEIDIIAAGFTITPNRALHVNFTRPYATGGIGMATNLTTTAAVERLEDLNTSDFAVAAIAGSVAHELAQRILPAADLRIYDTAEDAQSALVSANVDVYLGEEPVPTFLALEHPTIIDVPVAKPLLETPSAFAIGKGDADFLAFLNAWITAHEADTWLPTTHQYWFESLRWRDD